VSVWDEENQREIELLTNLVHLSAADLCDRLKNLADIFGSLELSGHTKMILRIIWKSRKRYVEKAPPAALFSP